MQEYVLIFPYHPEGKVLTVLKNRPIWQAGRINLPGGKVEPDELFTDAAIRELKEETGLEYDGTYTYALTDRKGFVEAGCIAGSWGIVYVYGLAIKNYEIIPNPLETEEFSWRDWDELKDDPRLLPNLRLIIPLMKARASGWTILDEGFSSSTGYHTFSVTWKLPESK